MENGILHHVSVGTGDQERACAFYDAVMPHLGARRVMSFPFAVAYGKEFPEFWIGKPLDEGNATTGNGAHVCFIASSREAVDAFHAAGLDAGGVDEGAPGPRPDYGPGYYGAFLRDPDGHKIEAAIVPGASWNQRADTWFILAKSRYHLVRAPRRCRFRICDRHCC